MSRKREKHYWLQRTERFPTARAAQDRAGRLRLHEHTAHVKVRPTAAGFEVAYAVAGWYLDALQQAGARL